ncbi:unnamed protein product [Chrysodeixis includens]|uniref:Zinc finger PHD-type domain-containing protein n=1 Tax=Chrysodeixis includens TaxID=689277 RepID=A0A9P0DY86_CHRIL|nr:unnamed protein product [Chrysodeixis includens]
MHKCGACGRFISPTEGVRCSGAKCGEAYYHSKCVGVKGKVMQGWRCPECKKNIARDNKAETPVRGAGSQVDLECSHYSAGTPDSPVLTQQPALADYREPASVSLSTDNRTGTTGQLLSDNPPVYQLILDELRVVREELTCFRKHMEEELATLKGSVSGYSERIDTLEKKVESLEQRACDSTRVDSVIAELRQQLEDRDQELLANDIEISHLPEVNSENPTHVVLTISQKLGVKLDERDIVSAERVGRRQLNAASPGGPTVIRPRPIVVRLTRRSLRDDLLKSARVRRGATTADLDMAGPAQRFYINERLTKSNRQLFRQARDAAGQAGWRFVWTKHGRILACCKPGDPTKRIRSETDIQALFVSPISLANESA